MEGGPFSAAALHVSVYVTLCADESGARHRPVRGENNINILLTCGSAGEAFLTFTRRAGGIWGGGGCLKAIRLRSPFVPPPPTVKETGRVSYGRETRSGLSPTSKRPADTCLFMFVSALLVKQRPWCSTKGGGQRAPLSFSNFLQGGFQNTSIRIVDILLMSTLHFCLLCTSRHLILHISH